VAYRAAYLRSMELWPMPFESRFIGTPFGTTHVVASGTPGGAPIVFVHAASLSATQWYLQALDLGVRHRLFAVDIMGDIGLSTETAQVRTRSDAARWLSATLDGLGLERAILVGSSFGGFLSANLAALDPDRVTALVLLAPAATFKPFRLLANLIIRSGSLLPLPATVKPGLRGMMQGELPDPRIVEQMEIGVAGFRYDRSSIYPSELPDAELASISCPTSLLLGDREMIYDPQAAARRARALVPVASVEVIEGVGHLLGMQRPDLVNPRIAEFVRGLPASSPSPSVPITGSMSAELGHQLVDSR
jgi:pimeloyl-ACP methyl ester carboxylesterase